MDFVLRFGRAAKGSVDFTKSFPAAEIRDRSPAKLRRSAFDSAEAVIFYKLEAPASGPLVARSPRAGVSSPYEDSFYIRNI